jgi:hypothetical protein
MWRVVEIPIIVTGASALRLRSTSLAEISMSQTGAKDPREPSQTLSDADISSERIARRRSFLRQTGLLVGGAVAVAAGVRAVAAGDDDPDKDGDDPVSPKASDPDKKKKQKHKAKSTDPDAKRATDPDSKRSTDPDARQPRESDPDKAPTKS